MNKDNTVANIKNSNERWSANSVRTVHGKLCIRSRKGRFRIQSTKCYPLLVKTFEENGGYADSAKLDELEQLVGGELTRAQISKWFHARRQWGVSSIRKYRQFSKPVKSFLLHVFAKYSGHPSGRELDEIEEALDQSWTGTRASI